MPTKTPSEPIVFLADKIYVHPWPLDSAKWGSVFKDRIDSELHKNKEKKKIQVKDDQIKINAYVVNNLKKIGMTIPLFKKETTMVFEGQIEENFAHIHITSKDTNYLEIFNNLVRWKSTHFPEDS